MISSYEIPGLLHLTQQHPTQSDLETVLQDLRAHLQQIRCQREEDFGRENLLESPRDQLVGLLRNLEATGYRGHPNQGWARRVVRGWVCEAFGDLDDAKKELLKSVGQAVTDDQRAESHWNLARLSLAMQSKHEAVAFALRAYELAPSIPRAEAVLQAVLDQH
jgi:hypothetical protein